MTTTTKTLKDMAQIIKELKEYADMEVALKKEIEALKAEAIDYMEAEGVDEVLTNEGKVTYREVLSKRFDSTKFKKEYAKLYEDYTRQTSSMRFTCN